MVNIKVPQTSLYTLLLTVTVPHSAGMRVAGSYSRFDARTGCCSALKGAGCSWMLSQLDVWFTLREERGICQEERWHCCCFHTQLSIASWEHQTSVCFLPGEHIRVWLFRTIIVNLQSLEHEALRNNESSWCISLREVTLWQQGNSALKLASQVCLATTH